MADTIDFNGASVPNNTGTWSFTPGTDNTLTATFNSPANSASDSSTGFYSYIGAISFTTGGETAASAGPDYTFATPGSEISVGGCGGGCFTGVFTSSQLLATGGGGYTFTGDFVVGTLSSALLTTLGDTNPSTDVTGDLTANLAVVNGVMQTESMDLTLTQTPEPSSASLLGFGLLGLVGMFRKRLFA